MINEKETTMASTVGLSGILYWYALYPMHHFIFGGMLKNIARAAREESKT